MYGKKAWLGNMWGGSGLASGSLRFLASDRLTILAYHRILDVPDEDAFPGDPELISASIDDFARQMKFVREHFDPIHFADIIESMERGFRLPRRPLVVTFDDGHHDNYANAFPVLRELGVPATIFVSTGNVDRQTPFWFDRVAQLLFYAPAGDWRLEQIALEVGDVSSRRFAARRLLVLLKKVPDATRLGLLEELEHRFADSVPTPASGERHATSWDEIREMSEAGVEFGSHTVTHPVLSRLDDDDIQRELQESRDAIRARTGQAVETIAYPVGKTDAYDRRVVDTARSCGYRLGVSYQTGINPSDGYEPFGLRRLAVERYLSFPHFKSMLSLPGVFA